MDVHILLTALANSLRAEKNTILGKVICQTLNNEDPQRRKILKALT